MRLTITELKFISEIGKGNKGISGIAHALGVSNSQAYRIIQSLIKKGIMKNLSEPEMKTHVNMLFRVLADAPNLSVPLSAAGIQIFSAMIQPKTAKQIQDNTGFHKTTVLQKIRQARKMSLVNLDRGTYQINVSLWPEVKDFLIELKKYEESIDKRIPVTSTIYFKDGDELVFSSKDEIDAILTGFSAYPDYGIKIYEIKRYYYLPKKSLSKREVFMHSLFIAEKEHNVQNLTLVALFYLKYKKELGDIRHPVLENIKRILKGHKVQGYPGYDEIEEKANVYDIGVARE